MHKAIGLLLLLFLLSRSVFASVNTAVTPTAPLPSTSETAANPPQNHSSTAVSPQLSVLNQAAAAASNQAVNNPNYSHPVTGLNPEPQIIVPVQNSTSNNGLTPISELGIPLDNVYFQSKAPGDFHLDVTWSNPMLISNLVLIEPGRHIENELFLQRAEGPVQGILEWPFQIINWFTWWIATAANDDGIWPVIPAQPPVEQNPPPAPVEPGPINPADLGGPGPEAVIPPPAFQPPPPEPPIILPPKPVISPAAIGQLAAKLCHCTLLDLPKELRDYYRQLALWILLYNAGYQGQGVQFTTQNGYWNGQYGGDIAAYPGDNLPVILLQAGFNPNDWLKR